MIIPILSIIAIACGVIGIYTYVRPPVIGPISDATLRHIRKMGSQRGDDPYYNG